MLKEDPRSLRVPVMKVTQPIGTFYVGCIKSKDLHEISDFDIRRIVRERDFETYLGIQRPIDNKRLEKIKQYVTTVDATFPTSVIIAVEEDCAKLELLNGNQDNTFGWLTLSNYLEPSDDKEKILYRHIARVIDGQHRIAGLEGYNGPEFSINVTIFIGADIADQASIFSTVNLQQTKVNRSLVYDLFALSQTRSPERTCHEIVVALDKTDGSPFYKRIKRLGVSTDGRTGETLTQANVVQMLLKYISDNPSLDRDLLKRGKSLELVSGKLANKLFFRNMFIKNQDFQITDIMWNYFDAVRTRWPNAWASTGTGYILNRTNGYRALMRLLRPAYLNFTTTGEIVTKDQFLTLFNKVDVGDDHFTVDQYNPGTGGETALFNFLVNATGLEPQQRLI